MQLILITDNTEIGIKDKMATLEHSASEKFDNTVIAKSKEDAVMEISTEPVEKTEEHVVIKETATPLVLDDITNNENGTSEKLTNGEPTLTSMDVSDKIIDEVGDTLTSMDVSDKIIDEVGDTLTSMDVSDKMIDEVGDSDAAKKPVPVVESGNVFGNNLNDECCKSESVVNEKISDDTCSQETTEKKDKIPILEDSSGDIEGKIKKSMSHHLNNEQLDHIVNKYESHSEEYHKVEEILSVTEKSLDEKEAVSDIERETNIDKELGLISLDPNDSIDGLSASKLSANKANSEDDMIRKKTESDEEKILEKNKETVGDKNIIEKCSDNVVHLEPKPLEAEANVDIKSEKVTENVSCESDLITDLIGEDKNETEVTEKPVKEQDGSDTPNKLPSDSYTAPPKTEVIVAKEKDTAPPKDDVIVAKEKDTATPKDDVIVAKDKETNEIQDITDKKVEDKKTETQPQKPVPKDTVAEVSLRVSVSKQEDKKNSFKLSNTLDILSDDEEDHLNIERTNDDLPDLQEKQTINIDDDDDIMLIDDDSGTKTSDKVNSSLNNQEDDQPMSLDTVDLDSKDQPMSLDTVDLDSKDPEISQEPCEKTASNPPADVPSKNEVDIHETTQLSDKTDAPKEVEPKRSEKRKPLVPENFFKTYKKNLAEMTRDDLEEFCVLKIVESIIDRSSLTETKAKLKSMAQSVEEYKKKAVTLIKQNRDLQVVLKSVQEEQKKNTGTPITPLKITRSVGMQVLMTEKNRRKTVVCAPSVTSSNSSNSSSQSTVTPNKQSKPIKVARPQKPIGTIQQIPVPRLVPASNVVKTPSQTSTVTVNKASPITNGVAKVTPPPAQKAEKRTHSRMQSVTVDLTDDEPPAKVATKSSIPPVRLVPSQNLLATRPTQGSSPRKVFIPISGAQNAIRPGQTVMVKSIPPAGPRQRHPVPVRAPLNAPRLPRTQCRHPAPLPDAMKQYQPPNWRALPPAPDLKLSKVENGIVISWKIEGYDEGSYEEIASYQLFAYQETALPPSTNLWKKIGDVKALPLPMACTLTQFMAGYKYYFAVRAVDIRSRLGPFSLPGSILLLNKM